MLPYMLAADALCPLGKEYPWARTSVGDASASTS